MFREVQLSKYQYKVLISTGESILIITSEEAVVEWKENQTTIVTNEVAGFMPVMSEVVTQEGVCYFLSEKLILSFDLEKKSSVEIVGNIFEADLDLN